MMTISQIVITRHNLTARAHAAVMKIVNRNAMTRHQYERLPKHFEELAYTQYGARQRSSKWNKRKLKLKKHRKPNVYTGILRQSVLNNVKITATQYGAKLTTRGTIGRKLTAEDKRRKAAGKKVDTGQRRLAKWQLAELQSMSTEEKRLETKRMAREYKRWATSEKYKRKRTKRIRA